MDAITAASDGNIQMIDTRWCASHQHAANVKKGVKFIVWAAAEED